MQLRGEHLLVYLVEVAPEHEHCDTVCRLKATWGCPLIALQGVVSQDLDACWGC